MTKYWGGGGKWQRKLEMMGYYARIESQDLPVYPQMAGILLVLLRPFHKLSLQHQERSPLASLQTPSKLPAYLIRTKGHIIVTQNNLLATEVTGHSIFIIFDYINQIYNCEFCEILAKPTNYIQHVYSLLLLFVTGNFPMFAMFAPFAGTL